MSPTRRAAAPLVLIVALLSLLMTGIAPADATRALQDALTEADERPAIEPYTDGRERHAVPADRYEMAGGCYVLSVDGTYVQDGGAGYSVAGDSPDNALPFHFQAFDLGKYLLLGDTGFLSADESPIPYTRTGANLAEDLVEGLAIEATDALVEYLNFTVEDAVGEDAGMDAEMVGDPARAALTDGADQLDGALAPTRESMRGTAVGPADAPSSAAEWVVRGAADGTFTFDLAADDLAEDDQGPLNPEVVARLGVLGGELALVEPEADAAFGIELVDEARCAEWEEITTNVAGEPARGDGAGDEAVGYLDAHLHMMAFEFVGGLARCGRPWHPYGVASALVDCPDHEPGGHGATLEHVLSGTDPVNGHDTTGWPDFPYWPRHNSLTHEQVYYKWMERAWRSGLRMFTNLLVDNGVLCEVYPLKENSCNEMDGVRLQILRLHELERYIDAQHGGPGEGWFRIVTDPFEAREVVNSGRLAVVMGIEISVLFDCGEYHDVPRCDEIDIDSQLVEFYEAGVRQMELVNKFDNALSGVTGDGGSTGAITNNGNRHETGHFIRMDTCADDEHGHDRRQLNFVDDGGVPEEIAGRDALAGGILATAGQTGTVPLYPEGPHCNAAGLTDLGRHLLDRMVEYGMLFDPDHMAALARHQALDHLEDAGYRGVISSHSWADDTIYPRVLGMGGVVTPYAGGAGGFVNKWRQHRQWANPDYLFGFGYGADTNGFGGQGGPEDGVGYPFTGLGGVTVDQQVSGNRVYDYATDGTAHYGLYADWVEAIAQIASRTDDTDDGVDDGELIRADMERGVEAYLQMWERAIGIAEDACLDHVEDLAPQAVAAFASGGEHYTVVLETLGQPASRADNTMAFCTTAGVAEVQLDQTGHVDRVRLSTGQ